MVVTAHYTNIEIAMRLLNFFVPIKVMYRPQNNALFEWVLLRARRRYTQDLILRYDVRGLLKSLKQCDFICYTPDQDYGEKSSIFAPFFKRASSNR